MLKRQRLFHRLRKRLPGTVVWLAASGGYGKTTLALSYARHGEKPVINLAIPENGLTAGEFFYELREEVSGLCAECVGQLQPFSPEYATVPERFARRFAISLTGIFESPPLLLLDNLHHLAPDDSFHALIAELACALADQGCEVLITSRQDPPPAWVVWRGRGRLELIDEPELAFDADEIEALLALHGRVDLSGGERRTMAKTLEEQTGGWVAALMLFCEHWRRTGSLPAGVGEVPNIDSWFEQEIYSWLEPTDQALLRCCAFPQWIDVRAVAEVSGIEDAAARLRRLCREHAFIQSEAGDDEPVVFCLHDLFRTFLRRRGTPADEPCLLRWGQALAREGDSGAAIPLLLEAGEYAEVAAHLKQIAGEMLQTGRGENIFAWLQRLPPALREEDPHLQLWEGTCLIMQDTRLARGLLTRSWEQLSRQGDYLHMAIAWTAIVDSIWLEWAHVSEYQDWITAFERHEAAFRRHLPAPLWFAALRGILTATCYGDPNSPKLSAREREAVESLAGEMPDTERFMLASQLMYLNTWQFGSRAGATRVMAIMRDQDAALERASPLARCLWHTFTSLWSLLFEGDYGACRREAEKGRRLIREYGIRTWDCAVPPAHAALCFGDPAGMEEWNAWFHRSECRANRPFYDTFQAHFLTGRAWLRGHAYEAVSHARASLESARRHGSVVIFAGFRATLASMLAESGDGREAVRHAAMARRQCQEIESDFLAVMVYMQLARIPLLRGQPGRVLPYLRRAFEAGARQTLFFPLMVKPRELQRMCDIALEHNIQPAYASWLRQRIANTEFSLSPAPQRDVPSALSGTSERALSIRVFGPLRLVDAAGEPIALKGRALELVKLLLAHGGAVDHLKLCDLLWPDAEGDAARSSFDTTLHRLRKQLGERDLIRLDAGVLSLNRERTECDLWDFEESLVAAAQGSEPQRLAHLERILALYQAPFLPGEESFAPLPAARQAVERKYRRAMRELARLLEQQGWRTEAERVREVSAERAATR